MNRNSTDEMLDRAAKRELVAINTSDPEKAATNRRAGKVVDPMEGLTL